MTNEEYMQAQKANEQAVATFMSPMQQQKASNLAGWQKDNANYKVCPKCKGDGVSGDKGAADVLDLLAMQRQAGNTPRRRWRK